MQGHRKPTRLAGSASRYAVLVLFGLLNLFPFYWTVLSSIKDTSEILVRPLALPRVVQLQNYSRAWVQSKIMVYFVNTVIVTAVSVIAIILVSAMAAYVVSRIKPSFLLYAYFTVGMMLPIHATIIPDFLIIRQLGLLNTRVGLSLVSVAANLSLTFFVLYGFLRTLPKELEYSAQIDGCSWTRIFFSIIVPIARPGIATVGIFALLNVWNNYLIPLVLVTAENKKVLSQGIQDLKGQYITDYGLVNAGIVIATIPLIILYVLFQEQVIKGATAGAVKG